MDIIDYYSCMSIYIYVINFCIDNEKPFYHSLIHYLVIIFLISEICLYSNIFIYEDNNEYALNDLKLTMYPINESNL